MKKLYAAISIVLMLVSTVVIQPARASAAEPGPFVNQEHPLAVPMTVISTPSYPVGINIGESKLVEYSVSETGNVAGQLTKRTLQFFTQYDVPLSDARGPYPTSIPIRASKTISWNELVYLPKAVVDQARAMDEYAIVLKTKFSGTTQSGATFETSARLLLLLPPVAFSKTTPNNGLDMQSINPSLHWDSSVGAVDYEYCFDTIDNNSCDTDWTGTYWLGTYKTNADLKNLPLETTFYWQVRANNTAGQTYANNGEWWSFTTCDTNLLTVLNTNDSGPGSLRQAITDSCPGGTIEFDGSLDGQIIALESALIIEKDLLIDASQLGQKINLDGNSVVDTLIVIAPDTNSRVALRGLVLSNASGYGIFNSGQELELRDTSLSGNSIGLHNESKVAVVNSNFSSNNTGIVNFGFLNVQDSQFVDNVRSIYSEQGLDYLGQTAIIRSEFRNSLAGAIVQQDGELVVTNSRFTNNESDFGGAILSMGPATITGSHFANNRATENGGSVLNGLNMTLSSSTFTNNSAAIDGGAVYSAGGLSLSKSTFDQNTAGNFGGGVFAGEESAVTNNTFDHNSAIQGGSIYFVPMSEFSTSTIGHNTISNSTGGGLHLESGSVHVLNNILANSVSGFDCYVTNATISQDVHNLIENNPGSPNDCGTPLLTSDPKLGLLSDNGGPTFTMALLAGSPAIDAGSDTSCPATDQRGFPRPQGAHCDIGAFESLTSPILIAPEMSEHVLTVRPTFDWHDLQNAIEYRIQISRNSTFTNLVKSVTVKASKYSPNFNLPANKTLYWRVRARTASGLTAWSEIRSFSTPNPPATPLLISPALNALNTNYMPIFKWNVVSLPTGTQFKHYQLQVDNNSDFASPEINDTSVTNRLKPQFSVTTPLASNTKYYWRVRAVNTANEFSVWSAAWYFRSVMLAPALFNPIDAEQLITVPTFTWEGTEGAAKYQIVVSRDENMSSPLVNTTVSALSFTPAFNLPPNKTLYWRVRGLGSNGPSEWSPKSSFITCNPPSIPSLISPASGSLTKDYTPAFNWSDSSVPKNTTFKFYEIEVDDNRDFLSPSISTYTPPNASTASQYTHDTDLDPNTKYYWRVRAISVNTLNSEDQYSAWSLVWSLRTALQSPTLLTPADNNTSPIESLKPILTWSPVDGATSYMVQASTSSTFLTLLVNATVENTSYQRLTPLPANRVIYWRVRANGVNGPSAWSQQFQFKTPNIQ